MIVHVQKRVINKLVRKSNLVQVKRIKRDRGNTTSSKTEHVNKGGDREYDFGYTIEWKRRIYVNDLD